MNLSELKSIILGRYYKIKYVFIFKKATIGHNFKVYGNLKIEGPGKIVIGNHCMVFPNTFGMESTTLYTYTPQAKIILEDYVILRGSRMGCYMNIRIGKYSVIEGASLFDSDFHNVDASKRDLEYEKYNTPIIISEKAYVGARCLIGKGMRIGSNSIILPGTFCSGKKTKPGSVIVGMPGRNKK